LTVSNIKKKPYLVYFVFLLETTQTALTGADVHYWFIKGFGNEEQLKDSHYAPIDIAIMHSIISLIVQEYFCYRIWTLNRRWSWFCVIIAIVRSFPILPEQAGMTLPEYRLQSSNRLEQLGVGLWQALYHCFRVSCLTAFQSVILGRYAVSKTALYVRNPVSSGSPHRLIVYCISYGRSRVHLRTFSLPSQ
jgi:hypothetical protein